MQRLEPPPKYFDSWPPAEGTPESAMMYSISSSPMLSTNLLDIEKDPYSEDRQLAATTETAKIMNGFNNSGLFSNHYLENMIQKVPEWDDDAHLRETFSEIKGIFEKKREKFRKVR